MDFIARIIEKFGIVGGIGVAVCALGVILVAAGGGTGGFGILVGGVVVIIAAKKLDLP